MENQQSTPLKVVITISITRQAHSLLFELASQRGVGDLVSRLIVEHYKARQGNPAPSPREIAAELREMADKLDPQP